MGGIGGQCPGAPELKGAPRDREEKEVKKKKEKRKEKRKKERKEKRKRKKIEKKETFQIPRQGPKMIYPHKS